MNRLNIVWSQLRTTALDRATRRQLDRRLVAAGRRVGVPAGEAGSVDIHLVDDREITRIGREHLGKRGPTDVLSFPTGDHGPGPTLGLGDIVLNLDAVTRQSASPVGSIHWLNEATVLLVHGLVHLLGHDHRTQGEGRVMHRVERAGLRAARTPDIARPYGCRPVP